MTLASSESARAQNVYNSNTSTANSLSQQTGQLRVIGAKRLTIDTVKAFANITDDEEIDDERINEIVKRLYASGYFSKVSSRQIGRQRVLVVRENPIINIIAFEGLSAINDEQAREIISLQSRDPLNSSAIAQSVVNLSEAYRQKGYFKTRIRPKHVDLNDGRVDVVFEIDEGLRGRIRHIRFLNNRAFSDSVLAEIILSRETAWYRFLSTTDVYIPARAQADRAALENFYRDAGFPNFRIISSTFEQIPNDQNFDMTFAVDEGDFYQIGTILIDNRVTGLPNELLQNTIDIRRGDPFSRSKIRDALETLTEQAQENGFPFVVGDALINQDETQRTANLTLVLADGTRAVVKRIEISGNTIASESVIRRYLPLTEGDAFNPRYIEEIKRRLLGTRLFSEVDVLVQRVSNDEIVMRIIVTEQATGSLNASLGFSSLNGIVGSLGWSEANVLGTGNSIDASIERGSFGLNFNFNFTQPYFFDRDITATYELFNQVESSSSLGQFTKRDIGGRFSLGFPLSKKWSMSTGYLLSTTSLSGVASTASLATRRAPSFSSLSSISVGTTWSDLNHPVVPTSGWQFSGSLQLAGLGGTKKYGQIEVSGRNYTTLIEDQPDLILTSSFDVGHIISYLKYKTTITDRFLLGGQSFGGFDNAGIGPRDRISGEPLGGETVARVGTELSFPIAGGLLNGVAFANVGTVFGGPDVSEIDPVTNALTFDVARNGGLRASAGLAVIVNTPIAPIRLQYGWPLLKRDYDKIQGFSFGLGTVF